MSDITLLCRLWLRKPRQIATWAPSGNAVATALAETVTSLPSHGHVIELGAGTGPVTAALLDAGLDRDRLCVIESDPELVRLLRQRFGATGIARADARALGSFFDAQRIDEIAAVVSTLPILNFGLTGQRAVLDDCFARALPGAPFTQITYLPGSPVRQRNLRAWGYRAARIARITSNWPPATLWQYHSGDAPAPTGDIESG